MKQTIQVLKFITIQEENLIGHSVGHNKKKNLMYKKILIVNISFYLNYLDKYHNQSQVHMNDNVDNIPDK